MSMWNLLSGGENTFRWEISDQQLHVDPQYEPNSALTERPSPTFRLPSMADLLFQGLLMENRGGDVESPPMFRTGLGKSVVVKKSSSSKALSIFGDEADAFADTGLVGGRENRCSFSNPMFKTSSGDTVNTPNSMFQTGSGKVVNISSSGLVRAKTLLGLEENYGHETFQGFERMGKQSKANESFGRQYSSCTEMTQCMVNTGFKDATLDPTSLVNLKSSSLESELMEITPDFVHAAPKQPPIKFHTAGGRSISVSSDALQRARSLLGDPEIGTFLNEGDAGNSSYLLFQDIQSYDNSSNKENDPNTLFTHHEKANCKNMPNIFVSPLRSSSNQKQSSVMSGDISSGSNLIKKFDAEAYESPSRQNNGIPLHGRPLSNRSNAVHAVIGDSLSKGIGSGTNPPGRSPGGPLVDISNSIHMDYTDNKQPIAGKRRPGRRSSASPFKRPRSSKFISPLDGKICLAPSGLSTLAPQESCCRRVSTRYPFQAPRKNVKDYFGVPPSHQNMLEHLPDWVRRMNPEHAEKHMFRDGFDLNCIGVEAFAHMLAQSGASMQYISEEWVTNHYKWIVWKLACYERCYPAKCSGKVLTVSNVFEELKYRYEREVNHAHRSAIKRILEGDAPASSMLVLCISSIESNCYPKIETNSTPSNGAEDSTAAKIELTDGWYSVNARLDLLLSKLLVARRLFVGQKLRIWGAGLSGWIGPVSPLEASKTISLSLHVNGTYRAHWADHLGFCRGRAAPLAFRCIKGTGGVVPSTLVGVTRIYPVMYRERLSNRGFVVRTERMEAKMMNLYNQRRSSVAEGIMSEFQRASNDFHINDRDSEEGAKILKILETAAEPEVLMAEMSSEQLTSFASYQAKLEATRQSDMQRSVEKALEDAGLSGREVSPFMRVRVVGLTGKNYQLGSFPRRGLITIWSPTEKQQSELVEGQAYVVAGLLPLSSDSDTLYLQARGSTTKWLPLSPSAVEHFEPFFTPRKPVLLSNLGEVPLSSEFDIAAYIVYVGEVYKTAHQQKQWVFVTDGSISELHSKEPSNSLVAISFCSPNSDCDSFVPINYNLAGSTIGFCNLIKRAKDQMNLLWVAEATENSTYFLNYDHAHCSHLKDAAASAQRWAKISSSTIEKLKGKVLSIIGNCVG